MPGKTKGAMGKNAADARSGKATRLCIYVGGTGAGGQQRGTCVSLTKAAAALLVLAVAADIVLRWVAADRSSQARR